MRKWNSGQVPPSTRDKWSSEFKTSLSEFQESQDYIEKFCLENEQNKIKTRKKEIGVCDI